MLWKRRCWRRCCPSTELFAADHADGTLRTDNLSPTPLALLVAGKTSPTGSPPACRWVLLAPVLGIQFDLRPLAGILMLSLLLGHADPVLIGAIGRGPHPGPARWRRAAVAAGATPVYSGPDLGAGAVEADMAGLGLERTPVFAWRPLALGVFCPWAPPPPCASPWNSAATPFSDSSPSQRFCQLVRSPRRPASILAGKPGRGSPPSPRPSGAAGLWIGLFVAPTDFQQGEGYRIIFIHVPGLVDVMFIYCVMAFWAAIGITFNTRLSGMMSLGPGAHRRAVRVPVPVDRRPVGKPMWGAWWVWDARLTSELILFFPYIGYIASPPPSTTRAGRQGRRHRCAGGRGQCADHLFSR